MFEQHSSSSSVSPLEQLNKRETSSAVQQLPGVREVRIILGGAFFSWLSIALMTFRSTDPSLFHVMMPAEAVGNWCGSLGAHCAAMLYVLFGPAAWGTLLFAVFVLPRPNATHWQLATRGAAAFGAMVSAGALFAAANVALVGPMTGGIFGNNALIFAQWIGTAGCVIAYSMALLFSLLFFAQVSLHTAATYTWAAMQYVAQRTWAWLSWFGRAVWAKSSQLWAQGQVEDEQGVADSSPFAGSGSGEGGSFNWAQPSPEGYPTTPTGGFEGHSGGQAQETTPEPEEVDQAPQANDEFEIGDTDWSDQEVGSSQVSSYEIGATHEEQVGNHTVDNHDADKDWHSFMPGQEAGEVAHDNDPFSFAGEQEADAQPPKTPAISIDDALDPEDDEQEDSSPADYFGLDDESEEEAEKVEIPDDGYDFTSSQDEQEAVEPMAAQSVHIEPATAEPATAEPAVEEAVQEEEESPIYEPPPVYTVPDATLFSPSQSLHTDDEAFMAACQERGRVLEEKLSHFGVSGRVVGIHPGPVITLFEYEPDVGSKVSKIVALEDDLAMSLKALSIRIIAPVPGKCVVGFEIANEERHSVLFADVIANNALHDSTHQLPIALGSDIVGNPVIADLATMPHLLVAGATGAGKSVGMNVMLVSLLASMSPDKVRMILIDPKRLEFAPYADVPHLLFPIVTSPYEVAPVLKWVVQEMELRYEVMAQAGVRNIADYHKLDPQEVFALEHNVGIRMHGMPYMVIMIDELADLMMVASKEIETLIARIAQMARAAGIHMIVATQRPSVDVVTGLIKANFPSRIAFRVSTKIDSRTIIDGPGAEKLLGKGDMLYLSPSNNGLQRLHGAYVTDGEINRLNDYLKQQREVEYFSLRQVVAQHSEQKDEATDPLYDEICTYLQEVDEISISSLQRKYRVGFNRSARLIEMLERDGHIAPAQGSKPRRVLRD